MSRITQADVVSGAIQQLSKVGGYTSEAYFEPKSHDVVYLDVPGEDVGATCAIGGVEQSIWRLTGEDVHSVRHRLAQEAEPVLNGDETPRQKLYAGVMRKLNAKARKLYPHLDGKAIYTVEEVTYYDDEETSLRRTLAVFTSVLADLEARGARA